MSILVISAPGLTFRASLIDQLRATGITLT